MVDGAIEHQTSLPSNRPNLTPLLARVKQM
jgi:hypothetical protein